MQEKKLGRGKKRGKRGKRVREKGKGNRESGNEKKEAGEERRGGEERKADYNTLHMYIRRLNSSIPPKLPFKYLCRYILCSTFQ